MDVAKVTSQLHMLSISFAQVIRSQRFQNTSGMNKTLEKVSRMDGQKDKQEEL